MEYQETAFGCVRTLKGLAIAFRVGAPPKLVWAGRQLVTIDYPERFGAWETPEQQKAFVRAFHAERVVTAMED